MIVKSLFCPIHVIFLLNCYCLQSKSSDLINFIIIFRKGILGFIRGSNLILGTSIQNLIGLFNSLKVKHIQFQILSASFLYWMDEIFCMDQIVVKSVSILQSLDLMQIFFTLSFTAYHLFTTFAIYVLYNLTSDSGNAFIFRRNYRVSNLFSIIA